MVHEPFAATEMLKALGDPIRWNILHQVCEAQELAASRLEETLPVSKPTISYHMKILSQAGLIEVLKRGRRYYYRVRTDTLNELIDEMRALASSGPHLMAEPATHRDSPRATAQSRPELTALRKAVGDDMIRGDDRNRAEDAAQPATLLTW